MTRMVCVTLGHSETTLHTYEHHVRMFTQVSRMSVLNKCQRLVASVQHGDGPAKDSLCREQMIDTILHARPALCSQAFADLLALPRFKGTAPCEEHRARESSGARFHRCGDTCAQRAALRGDSEIRIQEGVQRHV